MYPIPANATRIRYLESTGTQYVDTGIYYATPIEFQADVSVTKIEGYNCVFGCSTVTNRFFLGISNAGKVSLGMGGGVAEPNFAQSIVLGQRHLFRYQLASRRQVWQDGTSLWSGVRQPAPSNVSIWAFGSRRGPSESEAYMRSSDGWKGRIYSLKIMQGAGYPPVRDFVPVRVGSVGYLFDRVSGTLFGNTADNNAGFPAECLGPDTFQQGVVPTRMMVMGARKKLPTTWDYVQDGLYYQLDGIENAGRGVHSATATMWTDLTGNGRDATFINPSGKAWLDNAMYLYGKTSDGMAKIYGLPSMTAFTFEIVHRVDSYETAGRLWDTEAYFGGTEGKRFFGIGTDAGTTSINVANNGDLAFSGIQFVTTTAKSISVVPTAYSTTVAPYVYLNGSFLETKQSSTVRSPQTTTYIDVANRSNNANRGCDMAVFAIRVYSRVLTAAEIAHNYAIDKARFNLS